MTQRSPDCAKEQHRIGVPSRRNRIPDLKACTRKPCRKEPAFCFLRRIVKLPLVQIGPRELTCCVQHIARADASPHAERLVTLPFWVFRPELPRAAVVSTYPPAWERSAFISAARGPSVCQRRAAAAEQHPVLGTIAQVRPVQPGGRCCSPAGLQYGRADASAGAVAAAIPGRHHVAA